jgi:CrcB protein
MPTRPRWFLVAPLARNKLALILVGGALGTYLRFLLSSRSVELVVGPLVGGALGTYARYWLSRSLNRRPWGQVFPFGTLAVNLSGSFLLATFIALLWDGLGPPSGAWYRLLGVGLCGGFTTFSTFELETFRLFRDGSWLLAVANVAANLLGSVLAVVLAVALLAPVPVTSTAGPAFPASTLAVNLTGSFVLAVVATIVLERLPPRHQDWYLLIGTGVCGSYTTFSLFAWETVALFRNGAVGFGVGNAVGSIIAGFLCVLLGVLLVNYLYPRKGSP